MWAGIIALSLFSFVESPQLQALLADVTPGPMRDAAFSTYFALAFGVGSMWGIVYGLVIDIGAQGGANGGGLSTVFWLMAGASILAAIATYRIRIPPRAGLPPAIACDTAADPADLPPRRPSKGDALSCPGP